MIRKEKDYYILETKNTTYCFRLGKGDIREPFVEVIHGDGSYTSDFLYDNSLIYRGKKEFVTLPGSYGEAEDVDTLCLILKDKEYGLTLELFYYVYAQCDVIARSARFTNSSKETVKLQRLLSTQLDLDTPDYVFTPFTGA